MKTQIPLWSMAVACLLNHGVLVASDGSYSADDLETPDSLLQLSDPDREKVRYGDDDIVVSDDGVKNNSLVKPDPLERSVNPSVPNHRTKHSVHSAHSESPVRATKKAKHKMPAPVVPKSQHEKPTDTDYSVTQPVQRNDKRVSDDESYKDSQLEYPDPLLDLVR